MNMWALILVILRKEFRQALREPRMRVLLFLPPLLQLVLFGYAVNLDVDHVRIAWMDQDRTPASRDLMAAFAGSGRFEISVLIERDDEIQALLDRGKVQAVVRVLPGFARDIERRRPTAVQVLVEGTNSNTAAIVSSYATQIISSRGANAAPILNARARVWFNPDLKSRNYFVPGVIANI